MSSKTDIKVFIGGKELTLSGYESKDYLQTVANYINSKIQEMDESPDYKRLGSDMKQLLLQLNIADDYYKAKSQISSLEEDIEAGNQSVYNLKHDLIAFQTRLDEAQKEIENLKNENNELQKQIFKLESSKGYRK